MSDYLNADPEDYAEAVAWFNECKARRARDKARIAELEADLAEEARQADEAVDSCRERIAELEAELERLDSFDVGLDAALAKLEAENERLLNLNVAMLDAVAGQEAELAVLNGMLRLAWAAAGPFNAGQYLLPYEQWRAELERRWTARAEEGGE
jgi:chromosome segregation ATPase